MRSNKMGLFRETGDLPKETEEYTAEVWAEPEEAAVEGTEPGDETLASRLLKDSI